MARPPKAREPLKNAALELFVEQGVHGTGIREIAKHAKCSEAALYRHWANKDALVDALFREHLSEVTSLIEQSIAYEKTLQAKVLAACRACFKLYDQNQLVFRFVLLVQHELSKNLEDNLRTPHTVVVDLVRDGIAAGEAHGDPELKAAALIGIFLQVATAVLYGRMPGPLSSYASPVAAMAMRVLTA